VKVTSQLRAMGAGERASFTGWIGGCVGPTDALRGLGGSHRQS
jgi:hypothetical protein